MRKDTVVEFRGRGSSADPLTELLRAGDRQLIHQAVEAELQELLAEHSERRTVDGKAGVVRNGYLPERELQTGVGPVTVRIPKVRAKTGDPVSFRSAMVPPYVRKTKSLESALPWLYLKGISSGEMSEALAVLVGQDAKGLSASTVARLKQVWAEEYSRWREGRLDKDRWVYVWAGERVHWAGCAKLLRINTYELFLHKKIFKPLLLLYFRTTKYLSTRPTL